MSNRKRYPGMGGVTGLSAAMVDVLLTGDSEIDPFLMFVVTAEQIEAAWRAAPRRSEAAWPDSEGTRCSPLTAGCSRSCSLR